MNEPEQLILHHAPGADVCGSRNLAAQAAHADWLCFLDADDELSLGYLGALRPYLSTDNTILAPYVSYVSPTGVKAPPIIPNAGQWPDTNDTVTGALIRRRDFERVGGWLQTYWPWSDWELWLRAERHGIRRLHIPGAVYIANQSIGSENSKLKRTEAQALHRRIKQLHRQVWEAK